MNVQKGLERMSVVWWGFWATMCGLMVLMALAGAWNGRDDSLTIAALAGAGAAVAFGAHKVTCWVIRGFFAPR